MKTVAQIVVGLPVDGPFDYRVPEELRDRIALGHRVSVPFGPRNMTGYVIGFIAQTHTGTLKRIDRLLEDQPLLSFQQIELSRWMASYYGCSWGEAAETLLPFAVRKKKTLPLESSGKAFAAVVHSHQQELFLAQDSEASMEEIIRRIKRCMNEERGVLLLAPDRAAADKIYQCLESRLGRPVIRLDTGTAKAQTQNWLDARHGLAKCVLGLRSAVFTPLKDLGLAVMFGEHQYGYQEDQAPFYHARDILVKRAQAEGFDIIFSSPSPTVELWSGVEEKNISLAVFAKDQLAQAQLIDLTNYKPARESFLSFPLADTVGKALDNGERVLIIYNRRGFNTLIKCTDCGHVVVCGRCNVPYAYIDEDKKMSCPSCGVKAETVKQCPSCGAGMLHFYGEGIERIERNLAKFFPQAYLATFDRDTKKISKRANLIIATQAVLKVLDDLRVDLAGVLDIDAALSHFDFRCQQKVFSLLMEVRAAVRGKVFIQTKNPGHIVLDCLVKNETERFYRHELDVRRETGFPPAKHLLAVMIRGENEDAVSAWANEIHERLLERPPDDLEILAPQPDFQPKLRGKFRFMIMIKCLDVIPAVQYIKTVLGSVKKKRGVVMTIHVDP